MLDGGRNKLGVGLDAEKLHCPIIVFASDFTLAEIKTLRAIQPNATRDQLRWPRGLASAARSQLASVAAAVYVLSTNSMMARSGEATDWTASYGRIYSPSSPW